MLGPVHTNKEIKICYNKGMEIQKEEYEQTQSAFRNSGNLQKSTSWMC